MGPLLLGLGCFGQPLFFSVHTYLTKFRCQMRPPSLCWQLSSGLCRSVFHSTLQKFAVAWNNVPSARHELLKGILCTKCHKTYILGSL